MKRKLICLVLLLLVITGIILNRGEISTFKNALLHKLWVSIHANQSAKQDKAVVSPLWDYYSRGEVGMPGGTNTFSIGTATCLLNSARFSEEIAASSITVCDIFSHCGTLITTNDGFGYAILLVNPMADSDSPISENVETRLYKIDLNKMSIVETVTIARNQSKVGINDCIISGAEAPNAVKYKQDTIRVTFSARLTDGKWYQLYLRQSKPVLV